MKPMVGDVTVVGLDTTTTVLYDIGMDVPHRAVVTIPADRATMSKDLWRAISQRRVFQLHPGAAGTVQRPVVSLPKPNQDLLLDRCKQLEAENAQLRATLAQLEQERAQPAMPQAKIDEILSILKSGIPVVAAPSAGTVTPLRPKSTAVVEVDVPAFIPTEIKPKDIEGRITEVEASTSEASNLGSAASALRKFRKGQ